MSTYHDTFTEVANALDQCGIGHDLNARFNESAELITKFCASLQRRAMQQALYDLTTNVPCGILTRAQANGEHALKCAIAGAVGEFVQWGISEALEVAADIAEDVNAHSEAAQIRAMIGTD